MILRQLLVIIIVRDFAIPNLIIVFIDGHLLETIVKLVQKRGRLFGTPDKRGLVKDRIGRRLVKDRIGRRPVIDRIGRRLVVDRIGSLSREMNATEPIHLERRFRGIGGDAEGRLEGDGSLWSGSHVRACLQRKYLPHYEKALGFSP